LVADDAADARALDEAGEDRVDADAVGAELHRQRAGEADHAPFGGGVGAPEREAELAGGGAEVDDAAPAGLAQGGDGPAGAVEHRREIDLQGGVELLGGDVLDPG